MPKVYFLNGKVITITDGGATKVLTTIENFRFEVVNDIHGQFDVFERVCDGMLSSLPNGKIGDFIWAAGDTTSSDYHETMYPYQFAPDRIREVIDDKFGVNYPFYHSAGNHEMWDMVNITALEKNGIQWLKSEYNDITHASYFIKEDTSWDWYKASSGYPPNDGGGGGSDWKDRNYIVDEVPGWTANKQGAIGFGEIYSANPSINPPPNINTEIASDGSTITWCFLQLFNITNQSELDSIRYMRLESLYDDGCVIYLNGHELKRYNMPSGTIDYDTVASSSFGDESENEYVYSNYALSENDISYLEVGLNSIAIEVHQHSGGSNDMYCDAALYYSTSLTNPRDAISIRQSMSNAASIGKETTYAFEDKGCLFVNINMYYDGTTDDNVSYENVHNDTYYWLCNLLQNNSKPVFVFAHPNIGNAAHKNDVAGGFSGDFWKLLEDHQCVVAYICGHDHVYRRIQPDPSVSQIWHISNSPAGGPPRPDDGGVLEEDWTNQGFSFLDVYVNIDKQEVVFTRWVTYSENATGSWEEGDSWTQPFISCVAPECVSSSSMSSSSSDSSSSVSSSSSSVSSSLSSQSSSSSSGSSYGSSSSSSQSSQSSSSSSVSSSSSSSSNSSSSSSIVHNYGSSSSSSIVHNWSSNSSSSNEHGAGAFVLPDYSEKEALYVQYCPLLEGLTDEQKEDKLIDLVSEGNLSVDEALIIATKEGLYIEV